MSNVPTNLIPTRITQLPDYAGTSTAGYIAYVLGGVTYKVQFSQIAAVGEVPSTRLISTGAGLAGGGDLSADRLLYIPDHGVAQAQLTLTGVVAGAYGTASKVATITVDDTGRLTSVVETPIVLSGYVPTSRAVLAGLGLAGGGTLDADRTLSISFSTATPRALGIPTAGSGAQASREDHVHPAVNLSEASEIQGVLPLASGGTGTGLSPVAGAVVYSDDTDLHLTNPGNAGDVLTSTGTTAPVWASAAPTLTVTDGNTSVSDTSHLLFAGNVTVSGSAGNATVTVLASGGSPGGSTTDVQFNDGGVFGGDARFTWDAALAALAVDGTLLVGDGTALGQQVTINQSGVNDLLAVGNSVAAPNPIYPNVVYAEHAWTGVSIDAEMELTALSFYLSANNTGVTGVDLPLSVFGMNITADGHGSGDYHAVIGAISFARIEGAGHVTKASGALYGVDAGSFTGTADFVSALHLGGGLGGGGAGVVNNYGFFIDGQGSNATNNYAFWSDSIDGLFPSYSTAEGKWVFGTATGLGQFVTINAAGVNDLLAVGNNVGALDPTTPTIGIFSHTITGVGTGLDTLVGVSVALQFDNTEATGGGQPDMSAMEFSAQIIGTGDVGGVGGVYGEVQFKSSGHASQLSAITSSASIYAGGGSTDSMVGVHVTPNDMEDGAVVGTNYGVLIQDQSSSIITGASVTTNYNLYSDAGGSVLPSWQKASGEWGFGTATSQGQFVTINATGFNDLLAIGNNLPPTDSGNPMAVNVNHHIAGGALDGGGLFVGFDYNNTDAPGGGAGIIAGLSAEISSSGTGDFENVTGFSGSTVHHGTGSVAILVGGYFSAGADTNAGHVALGIGAHISQPSYADGMVVDAHYGILIDPQTSSGDAQPTLAYNLYSDTANGIFAHDAVTGNVVIGDAASLLPVSSSTCLGVYRSFAGSGVAYAAATSYFQVATAGGLNFTNTDAPGAAGDLLAIVGGDFNIEAYGTGDYDSMAAFNYHVTFGATGTLNTMIGSYAYVESVGAGTVVSAYGSFIDSPGYEGGTTVGINAGMYIADQTLGIGTATVTANYNIYSASHFSQFVHDASTGFIGIGTDIPDNVISVVLSAPAYLSMKNTTAADGTGIILDANRNSSDQDVSAFYTNWNGNSITAITTYSGLNTTTKDEGYLAFATANHADGLVDRMFLSQQGYLGIGTAGPASTLDVCGSQGRMFKNLTVADSPYTPTDADDILYCDASGGAITIALPAVATVPRRYIDIQKTDSSANTITVDGDAAETINGAATQVLTTQYESILIHTPGATGWFIR